MRISIFTISVLFFFSACGQTNQNRTENKISSEDTLTVFKSINNELCDCSLNNIKGEKPSTTIDSCYQKALEKYTHQLTTMGYDPKSPSGKLKLTNEVVRKLYFNCPEVYALLQQETESEKSGKTLFKGEIKTQTKLNDGRYEIILENRSSNLKQTFYSNHPIYGSNSGNSLYEEVTLEYEVRTNPVSGKKENIIKESSVQSTISVEKVN